MLLEEGLYDVEKKQWIKEGILILWNEEAENGALPLIAGVQPTKHKVRQVLDFRELNDHVSYNAGGGATNV